jgi:hypothetical protein
VPPSRLPGLADIFGMVRVRFQHRPLTASAVLVWNGDLPQPLQQMLFETAEALAGPRPPRPAKLVSLTTA